MPVWLPKGVMAFQLFVSPLIAAILTAVMIAVLCVIKALFGI